MPTTSAPPPTEAPKPCDPAILAPPQAEPLPPRGVQTDALLSWLSATYGPDVASAWFKWVTVTHETWAKEGWARVAQARTACSKP